MAEHLPILEPVLGPAHEDEPEAGAGRSDWDGTLRLRCSCGWADTRIYADSKALADVWRDHVSADTWGIPNRGTPG